MYERRRIVVCQNFAQPNTRHSTSTTSFHPPFGECSKILHSVRASNLAWLPLAVHSDYSERMCLYARTILVALENDSGWLGELSWLARGIPAELNWSNSELAWRTSRLSPFFAYASTKMRIQYCLFSGRWSLAILYRWKPHNIWQRSRHCRGRLIASYGFGWWRFSEPAYCSENSFLARRGGWKLVVNKAV